jgi:5'-deoxynucleotidase YfbR-like HD superfamily hydrolase
MTPYIGESTGTTVQLLHGEYFDPFKPDPQLINLDGLATALSHICRFTGNVKHHYSVAQHAVLVSENCHPGYADCGLHHDDPEGLGLNDLAAPIKHHPALALYRELEDRVMDEGVIPRFGLPAQAIWKARIKVVDVRMVITEKRDLKVWDNRRWEFNVLHQNITPFAFHIDPWPAPYARERYLQRHEETEWLNLLSVDERNREGR